MKNITKLPPVVACCVVIATVLWLPESASLYAQQSTAAACLTTSRHQLSKSGKQIFDIAQKRLNAYLASTKTNRTNAPDEPVHTIPVVVHILEPEGRSLLTDFQVHEGIAELNKAFRNQLPESDGVDTGIQFQLAVRTPDCSATTGINRVYPNNPNYTLYGVTSAGGPGLPYDQVYPMSYWNNLEYYNIWVVNFMDQGAALAAYPTGAYSPFDGTMITASYFTTKILPHELGHALFLGHTFARAIGGGDLDLIECPQNSNCAEQGDYICDTEPVNQSSNYICFSNANPPNPCNNNAPYGTVLKNYMGYNTFGCQTQFTNDQRTRMRGALESLRTGLINSKGLDPVVTGQTIPQGISATLTATGCSGQIQWYDAPADGNHLGSGNSLTTPVLYESTTYYASCLRADCPSDARVAGLVTVGPGLPVHLVRFGAQVTEPNTVTLNWATSFETMHDYFDVESARDAKTFGKAGRVSAPFRVTSGISEYRFADTPEPPADIIYYRLKQVDTDGSYSYSKMVSVRMQEMQKITIGPNPAGNSISIAGVSRNWDIEVIDARGMIVQRLKNRFQIDSERLPAGLYVIRVNMENGHTVARKIIKSQ
ncbi:M43 family zinc metalloprotease [Dyadobacter sp. 676]|uniref:M43 family zinc metalloprotease n=1 Tax=Dyadobacter sp. 676 TaxID=3088362 RepID=A0AAU8FIB1_9BACT